MRYIIHCLLTGPVVEYHRRLVEQIADRFALPFTRDQALPPHFTLKYDFETSDISVVERLANSFCRTHTRTLVRVGGSGAFPPNVAFLNVALSEEARQVFGHFLGELRTLPWLTWSPYDGESLHFHATVAERC